MKYMTLVLAVTLVALGMTVAQRPAAATAAASAEDNIHFHWAFEALVQQGGAQKPVAIKHDTTLQTGDKIRMLIEFKKPCFVYVLYRSSQGDMSLLFPYTPQQLSGTFETAKTYYIPQSGDWFELDNTVGRETFYVLASSQRLRDIETLLADYASVDNAKKPELAAQITTTIQELRKRHRQLATAPERPATIAGNLRFATEAVSISAQDFYAKTFTIDHQ